MDVKTTLPISEARKRIFELARAVQRPGTHYTLTAKGRPKAVMISAEEFESLIETIEVYRQFPNLDRDFQQARRELKEGRTVPLDVLLEEAGMTTIKQAKRKYVPRRDRHRGKKRSANS